MGARIGGREPQTLTLTYPYEVFVAECNGKRLGVYTTQQYAMVACVSAYQNMTHKSVGWSPAMWDRSEDGWQLLLEGVALSIRAERLRVPPRDQTGSDGQNGASRRRQANGCVAGLILLLMGAGLGAFLVVVAGRLVG